MKIIGKFFIALGILHLYRSVRGSYSFGGYVDNAWAIIFIRLALIIVGLTVLFLTNTTLNRTNEKPSNNI